MRVLGVLPLLVVLACGDDPTTAPDDLTWAVDAAPPTDLTKVADCPAPTSGQYVAATCDSGTYRLRDCSVPRPGEYVVTPCVPGSASLAGSDTVVAVCTPPGVGTYTTAACVAGSAAVAGQDTAIAPCDSPAAGSFTQTACVPGSAASLGTNAVVVPCSAPGPTQYTTAICISGSANSAGVDTVTTDCTAPSGGEFVTAACVSGSATTIGDDTTRATCSTAGAGQYVATACVAGSTASVGSNALLASCTAIAHCASGLACTTASDSTCGACTSGYALQSANTVCALLPSPPLQLTAVACNGQAFVSFSAGTANGGPAISGYTVTSSPGGISASAASSPIIVPGLTNDTAYTFTVVATNAVGSSAPSSASNRVTPRAAITAACGDVLFAEDFETPGSQQLLTSSNNGSVAWHQEADVLPAAAHFATTRAATGTSSLHFANVTTGTYQDPPPPAAAGIVRVTGTAVTPTVVVPSSGAMLSFSFAKSTDGNGAQDQLTYEIIDAANTVIGGPYQRYGEYPSFQTVRVPVPYDPQGVRVRFRFDSINGTANDLPGVFIDDVVVQQRPACANGSGATSAFRGANGHCYLRFDGTPVNWDQAETACQGLVGHLAAIADAAENAAVLSLTSENVATWIGYTDLPPMPPLSQTIGPASPPYVWSSGDPSSYTNWAAGEPNNSPYFGYCQFVDPYYCTVREQDCAQQYATGQWDDLECWSTLPYVCEVP